MRFPVLIALAAALLSATAACGQATTQPAAPAAASVPGTPPLTQENLDAWLDGLVPNAMRTGDIPGAVVVVVKDGKILTERGYGYADVARRIPVDPARTLFRPGSITKAFTWTAVMQLVEAGKLDLDVDVNRYLDFKIPPRDGKPITMRNIMTHTSGFEERVKGIIGPAPQPSLGAYLKAWTPKRIFAPGAVPAYSNYASALAGYIVERVSGQPLDDYMDQHVLGPLGMTQSTFRQPLPANLRPLMSEGYLTGSGPPRYYEFVGPAPAGGLTATGHDMGAFMIAHLQNGRFGAGQILSPSTAEQMHAIQPRIYPALHGMALGFYEHSRNGHRVIAHDGGTQFFWSDMHLFLDDGVGVFISLNAPGKTNAASVVQDALFQSFADRYFPPVAAPPARGVGITTALRHAKLMAGPWENSRRSQSSIFSTLSGLLGPLTITANADGTISLPIPRRGVVRWREIEPFVWQETDGPEKIQALVVDGRPVMLGFDLAPPAAFQRYPTWRSPSWMGPALTVSFCCLLLTGLAWPIAALARRRFGARLALGPRAAKAHHLSRGLVLATAVVALTLLGTLIYMVSGYDRLSAAMDPWLTTVKVVAILVFPASLLASLYDAVLVWTTKRSWRARVWSIVLVAAGGMVVWTALVFHVANFGTHY